MEHGERYASPVLMLKKLIEEKQGTTLTVSYDIACKLKAHFEVMFSTRMVENCGLTDGEEMERLWSYLRPFCHITKEMTPSHRVDLLSDALLHYGRKKANDIVDVIGQRTEKARLIHQRAMEQLQDLIKGTKLSWKEEYVNKLQSYQHFRDQLVATDDEEVFVVVNQHCERIDRELKTLEARHHIQRRWVEGEKDYNDALKHLELQQKGALIRKLRHDVAEYHFLQETMRKEGAGQAIATRIKKQLEKASQIINNTVTRYNKNNFRAEFLLPGQVLRKDALNTQHDMYYVQEERRSDVNQSLQHKAVRLLNLAQRAEEEKDFVKAEKDNVLQHYKQCCERLETAASSRTEQNVYVSGLRHLMVKKMQDYKDTVTKIQDAFLHHPD
ncbi:uncharacterized protein [Amphiura filiformis]|uniref:uncharacterized protein n=1 Tax=Amphiura filiformis TaxID=82378 RepID=UPI003B20C565